MQKKKSKAEKIWDLINDLIDSYEEPSGLNSYDYKYRSEVLIKIKKALKVIERKENVS